MPCNDDEELVADEEYAAQEKRDTVKKLREDLVQCRTEKDEYLTGWQRARADFVNAKHSWEEEYAAIARRTEQTMLTRLLAIAETFERAFKDTDEANMHVRGFRQIYAQLESLLASYGVTRIAALHTPFNVAHHEALGTLPVTDIAQDGIVLEELESGYMRNGMVLKPSRVRIGIYNKK